jgi:hypothetical protein
MSLACKRRSKSAPGGGASPCLGFLELADFVEFLAPFQIEVVYGGDGRWDTDREPQRHREPCSPARRRGGGADWPALISR